MENKGYNIYSDNDLYWLWLSTKCAAGSTAGEILIDAFGFDAAAIYHAGKNDYTELAPKLKSDIVKQLADKDMTQVNELLDYCGKNNIGILTLANRKYPQRLMKIRTRPLVLYYKGTIPEPDIDENVCIAMVGTRRMSEYGRRSAYTIAHDLARCGAIVVSGMAIGVDGICHRAALDAGGFTIAVLGCGIDKVYPPEHFHLMEEIGKKGLIITEYRPFTPPYGENFPVRNRIISGLSQGTLVVEADYKSGALITARTALLQGRDIFALPGKVGEQNSIGTNNLIRDGAIMVTHAADILEEYESLYPDKIDLRNILVYKKNTVVKSKPKPNSDITPVISINPEPDFIRPAETPNPIHLVETDISERIIKSFGNEPLTTDDLVKLSGIDVADVMIALTELEISGQVKSVPGGKFIKLT